MLVLTRRVNEKIRIGDNIIIKVLEVKGSQVRLGIDAPEDVKVYREELYQRILGENLRASQVNVVDFDKLRRVFKKR